jgi:serine/threonine protein kinase
MDTAARVVARFEAERQALAVMSHPAIAQVFDAGATPQGRPYFALEYVRGAAITTYCDQHRLSIRQRIDLFLQVCEGVHHAHQKGIIHRDLKPSNILVTVRDDLPVPKIIDFGLAKATTQLLTDRMLVTEFGTMVGTPEYMSPEQSASLESGNELPIQAERGHSVADALLRARCRRVDSSTHLLERSTVLRGQAGEILVNGTQLRRHKHPPLQLSSRRPEGFVLSDLSTREWWIRRCGRLVTLRQSSSKTRYDLR